MKSFFLILFATCTLSSANAQVYYHNLDTARMDAVKDNQQILMVFAGSDWCKPCMQFKQEVLQNEVFQSYANQKMKVLYLDFPARKKNELPAAQKAHNEALAEKYNRDGSFPKIVLVTANEKMLGEIPYKLQTPEKFIENCKSLIK